MAYGWDGWRPYVSVAERRRRATREIARFRKKGRPISPVAIQGRVIAKSFWGRAWCDNLEAYSDFANRLPRGRTYVRNGSVMHLEIGDGTVQALVSGSELYRVSVTITALPRPRWLGVVKACAGKIDSLVELLQGKLSRAVMEVLIRRDAGLFPSPRDISFECSCPDWAAMCKHVAATLYGVGARLDQQPDLFFRLRRVDQTELLTEAGTGIALTTASDRKRARIADSALADVFGIEMDATAGGGAARTPNSHGGRGRGAEAIASRPVTRTRTAAARRTRRPSS